MYGLVASDRSGSAPAYKPSSVLTNHTALASVLQDKCGGGHRHVQVVGKQAFQRAAVYPRPLCEAIVKGTQIVKRKCQEALTAQRTMVDQGVRPLTTESDDFLFEVELEDLCEEDASTWEELASQRWDESTWPVEETRDSTIGELLGLAKVHAGGQEE